MNLKPNPLTVHIPQAVSPAIPQPMAPGVLEEEPWFPEVDPKELREFQIALGKFMLSLRNAVFDERIAAGYTGPIIVSEGDSWFLAPSKGIVHKLIVSYNFAIYCVEMWGDTLESMDTTSEYLQAIQAKNASILLFSGGGNDILANDSLREYLIEYDQNLSPREHLTPEFNDLLDNAMAHYFNILQNVQNGPQGVWVICHGYDYVIPNSDASTSWLGKAMKARGIVDKSFQELIARAMVDEFNERLRLLVDGFSNATYLDLRGMVGRTRWFDEIHPDEDAFADIAAKFKAVIDRLFGLV